MANDAFLNPAKMHLMHQQSDLDKVVRIAVMSVYMMYS